MNKRCWTSSESSKTLRIIHDVLLLSCFSFLLYSKKKTNDGCAFTHFYLCYATCVFFCAWWEGSREIECQMRLVKLKCKHWSGIKRPINFINREWNVNVQTSDVLRMNCQYLPVTSLNKLWQITFFQQILKGKQKTLDKRLKRIYFIGSSKNVEMKLSYKFIRSWKSFFCFRKNLLKRKSSMKDLEILFRKNIFSF